MDNRLLELLVCPLCKGPLTLHRGDNSQRELICHADRLAFPVRELFQVKLRDFDLIVFDRFSNRGILPAAYLRNIADYVRGGGALLMSTGLTFGTISSLFGLSHGIVSQAQYSALVAAVIASAAARRRARRLRC